MVCKDTTQYWRRELRQYKSLKDKSDYCSKMIESIVTQLEGLKSPNLDGVTIHTAINKDAANIAKIENKDYWEICKQHYDYRIKRIEVALGLVSELDEQILRFVYVDGKTYDQAAIKFSYSPSNIKRRITSALKYVAKMLP